MARKRNNKVCSMEKANVIESGILWREECAGDPRRGIPGCPSWSHMYADAGAMQLTRAGPRQSTLIVTDNLFGDLLSDLAAMLTGSLGMLPSASLGAPMANGRPKGAVRAGARLGTPTSPGRARRIRSPVYSASPWRCRYSFDLGSEAERLEAAVNAVLADGVGAPRTSLGAEGSDARQHRPRLG